MKSIFVSRSYYSRQSGVVSIFVVIFAMLLMSVVTISFVRIMVADQQQASNNDLSQSAYDSAQAGVEDAKRALVWYTQQCPTGTATTTSGESCSDLANKMASATCNDALVNTAHVATASSTGGASGVGEVPVQSSTAEGAANDAALNQAYTCVTLALDTSDYVGSLSAQQGVLVPLVSTGTFNQLTVKWFSHDDISTTDGSITLPSTSATSQLLLSQQNWGANTPPVLRAQYMQVGSNFTLSDFDSYVSRTGTDESSAKSNTNTLFLYPSSSANVNARPSTTSIGLTGTDIRSDASGNAVAASSSSAPLPILCQTSVSAGGYACSATFDLPSPMETGSAQAAYLLLTPFYTSTHFQVTLGNSSGTAVLFKGVQPLVDSTGRAGDLFRRVQSRVDLYATTPYINGAVNVTNNFCKDFGVTDTQYIAGSCTQ